MLYYILKCLPHANLKITSHPRQKMLPSAAETPEKVIETPYENYWGK